MLFDNLDETKKELTGHIDAACSALAFLNEVDVDEVENNGPKYREWVLHMNALNRARVRLTMAAQTLHEELNRFNDEVL